MQADTTQCCTQLGHTVSDVEIPVLYAQGRQDTAKSGVGIIC